MGKNTKMNRKKKMAKMRKKKALKPSVESLSIEELLAAAQEEIDNFQYEDAQKLCQEALKREPDNLAVLEMSSNLCLEVGNYDGARHCLGRAITLQPDQGHEKYMSMAQLMEGRDSLQCYQKGIEILTRRISGLGASPLKTTESTADLNTPQDDVEMTTEDDKAEKCTDETAKITTQTTVETSTLVGDENASPAEAVAVESKPGPSASAPKDERVVLVQQLSTAHCSVAELFMTDLCDEEEAEKMCCTSIMAAIDADPNNPEACQQMASFLLVKQEVEEAKSYIRRALDMWLPRYREVREGKAAAGSFDPVEVCPLPYPTRLITARILIEVEEYKDALEVLEGLTEEDDEVVDTWYLLGWSYYLQGEEHKEAAQYYLHRAEQVHAKTPSQDTQLMDHLKELVEELGPYTEGEDEGEEIEEELERDSEEEEDGREDQGMDTS